MGTKPQWPRRPSVAEPLDHALRLLDGGLGLGDLLGRLVAFLGRRTDLVVEPLEPGLEAGALQVNGEIDELRARV